ncbi:efflux RND transporter permease subunit, partial [bacterium]|nr:efflux RND transporter permease subunit [bacterium]
MSGAVAWFARNHVAANLLMLLVVAAGLVTAPSITQEVFPEIRPNTITVTVAYPGAAPDEVEDGVCIRVEEAVQGVDGVDRVTSTAAEGQAAISVELLPDADVSAALDEVKSRVDAIDTFPEDIESPVIREVLIQSQVVNVVVSGDVDEKTLKRLGEQVRDDITGLPGITNTQLVVARPYEIAVEVSESALREYGLSFDEVVATVRRSSLDVPGGSVKTRGGEILLRTIGQAEWGDEFRALVLRSRPDGSRLLLGDVATIVDGFEDTGQSARFDDAPAVVVQVFRVGEQRAIDVSRKVREYVAQAGVGMPEGVKLTIWEDDAEILKSRLDLLVRNGVLGFFLVLAILALFLKLRLAIWVALGIPISFLGAIWMMPVLGLTVNLISLFAFIVVLGLAVDDAIVVGESVHWKLERGRGGIDAAIEGTLAVKTPVVFAVLTTVAAFAPLMFLAGRTGQIWRVIPLIVIPTLVFSLVESIFVLPAHLSSIRAGKREARTRLGAGWARLQGRVDGGLQWFIRGVYEPTLKMALQWRYATLAVGFATFVLTMALVVGGWIKFSFFPSPAAENIVALVTMPTGTPSSVTAQAVRQVEDAAKTLRKEVEDRYGDGAVRHTLTSLGEQPYRSQQRGPGAGGRAMTGEHLGEVNLRLAPMDEVEIDADAVARRWRELTGSVADAEELTFVTKLFSTGDAIDVQLASSDTDELRAAADELKAELADFPGVVDITDSYRAGKKEVKLAVTPEAEALGVTMSDLGRQVRAAFFGVEAQSVQRGREDVKVMVRYPEASRQSLADLESMRVRAPGGVEVPFPSVASAEYGRGFSSIQRADRQRVINVTASVDEKTANANEILASLKEGALPRILGDHPRVSYSLEGEQRQQSQTFASLRSGFAVALLVIFTLLAIPLRSYTHPIVIMGAIPLGFVGAVWGHVLMGMNLTMLSAAGFVALSGVVVNDSLVMVEYVNGRRREGMTAFEAVRVAGPRRFRAIMLTSLSTFAGVTPLLLEKSLQAQFLKPLAVSLGFGVLFSTFLILVIVPASYLVLIDVEHLVLRWFGRIPG